MNDSRSAKWSVLVTVAVIFGLGLVLGMWLKRGPSFPDYPPPPSPDAYQAMEAGEAVVMDVYHRLSPAVVNIVATSLTLNFWMQPVPKTGQGTGFVIDQQGHIITNNHVVGNARKLEVTFQNDVRVDAELVGRDPVSDLAIIKVSPFPGMKVAPLGNSAGLVVGQRVIAIGNPFGFQHTVTSGFISALNRDITVENRTMTDMIQTDAAINPGNSGGPLINAKGEVIGVNSAIYSQTGGFMGIGLAMPINRARKVAADIIRWGRAIYPWIGIRYYLNVGPDLANALGMGSVDGILVVELAPGSPADQAGLRGANRLVYFGGRRIPVGGDLIVGIDGTSTPTFDDYRNILLEKEVGQTVTVHFRRSGRERTVNVTLAAHPGIER